MKRFSKEFKTFEEWQKQSKPTPYKKKIERLYALHPQASLSQLRRHPKKRERPIGKLRELKTHKLDWDVLTPRENEIRQRSLEVLSQMRRKKKSLTMASREIGVLPETVIKHTNALKKIKHRWHPKKFDKIQRRMGINENGKEISITVEDSRHASLIGKYQNAVKKFLDTGDMECLKPFKNKRVKDSDGNWHTLDTNPSNIYEIQEMREEEEFYTIYQE